MTRQSERQMSGAVEKGGRASRKSATPFFADQLTMSIDVEKWTYTAPFRITGFVRNAIEVIVVSLERDGQVGRGEAAGVRYHDSTVTKMVRQLKAIGPRIAAGINRDSVQAMLPAGGARNALDCALWDLEAKVSHRPVWQLAGLERPHSLLTMYTCGADEPENMAHQAQLYTNARAIKLKLTGEPSDGERVKRVREARPDVWLSVDANQGFSRASLSRLMPLLIECRVAIIEQPFPAGEEALLDGFHSPIPIVADESVQSLLDIPTLVGRFDAINIKLDKCGGFTEGLVMARAARSAGLKVMVGNMGGTSLAMAPAFLLGQICDFADLDGPLFLDKDRALAARYSEGFITCPESLWGYAGESA